MRASARREPEGPRVGRKRERKNARSMIQLTVRRMSRIALAISHNPRIQRDHAPATIRMGNQGQAKVRRAGPEPANPEIGVPRGVVTAKSAGAATGASWAPSGSKATATAGAEIAPA